MPNVSSRYEVVFACFLRRDTPDEILDALRWHLGQLPGQPPAPDGGEPASRLLSPDPDSVLPGGDVASLQLQHLGSTSGQDDPVWGLFSRTLWPEDAMTELTAIMELVAPHVAEDGYGGFYREEHAMDATAFAFSTGTPPESGGTIG